MTLREIERLALDFSGGSDEIPVAKVSFQNGYGAQITYYSTMVGNGPYSISLTQNDELVNLRDWPEGWGNVSCHCVSESKMHLALHFISKIERSRIF